MNRAATIFSIITTAGLVAAIVSGVGWGLLAATHHEHTGARRVFILTAAVTVICFLAFLKAYDPALSQRHAQAPAGEPVSAVETSARADTQAAEAPDMEPQEETEGANPMLCLAVETRPVMNGTGAERIGTWAFVETTKAAMAEITDQQLHTYLTDISAEGYNWFNIFFEDGTGLYATMPGFVEYGAVDKETGGTVEPTDDAGENVFLFTGERYSNES